MEGGNNEAVRNNGNGGGCEKAQMVVMLEVLE